MNGLHFLNYINIKKHIFRKWILFFFFFFFSTLYTNAQDNKKHTYDAAILLGFTAPSNEFFPGRSLQKQLLFNISHLNKSASYFTGLRSGISLAITDFGNAKELGYAFSIIPSLEFPLLKNEYISITTGIGASYFTKKYDFNENFNNRAVSSAITWSFRSFINYEFLKTNFSNYRLSAGISHHSNGHSKLPNNGYNSFLISLGMRLNRPSLIKSTISDTTSLSNTSQKWYIETRLGIGQNVFNDGYPFNNRKEVYTLSNEIGYNFKNRFKIGVGLFYRFYEHYYTYINNNESLVQQGREFENLKTNPIWNGSNIAIFTKGEILLNHIGMELLLGINLHKPAYDIDWRINEGWDFAPRDIPEPPAWQLGELNSKFKLKKLINARLGIKYYFFDTQGDRLQNWYAGIFLNANLGQADFTELALGYNFKL